MLRNGETQAVRRMACLTSEPEIALLVSDENRRFIITASLPVFRLRRKTIAQFCAESFVFRNVRTPGAKKQEGAWPVCHFGSGLLRERP